MVCAFGQLIKPPLLDEVEMLNVHPSLLPRWRGAAPIERAIMAGDAETGVAIMRLTEGLDSGPVALLERVDDRRATRTTARSRGAPRRRWAASWRSGRSELHDAGELDVRRAARRGRHLRREDRRRQSAGSTRPGPRSSSSGRCGRSTPTSATYARARRRRAAGRRQGRGRGGRTAPRECSSTEGRRCSWARPRERFASTSSSRRASARWLLRTTSAATPRRASRS